MAAPPPSPGVRNIRNASGVATSPPEAPHVQFQTQPTAAGAAAAATSESGDVFDIRAKNPSATSLQKWRSATLVLNATRRFRYTGHLDEEERLQKLRGLQEQRKRKFRASANAVMAVHRFQSTIVRPSSTPAVADTRDNASSKGLHSYGDGGVHPDSDKDVEAGIPFQTQTSTLSSSTAASRTHQQQEGSFGISAAQLMNLVQNRDLQDLQLLGKAPGIATSLRSDLEKGIDGSDKDMQQRKTEFGRNTYPRQPPRWFIAFFWDACKDPTLIILMICALLSLIFGIRGHGWEEGWYDGVSIAFAVLLVISVTSVSDYRQSLQFTALNEEKRNIQVQVIRDGRRVAVSIFDLVVGDIAVLGIGDQVPADGIFVSGHSLTIDESSMTGESKPVQVNAIARPFLLSGCKVADGYGTMLVTGVGINTEWGQLMAVIGEETGEETPLQVRLNGVATFIGKIGLFVASLVLVILIVFYFVGHKAGSNGSGKFKAGHTSVADAANSIVDAFAIAVTIVVVAVPEGLPLAVTLTLAYSMKKMMIDKALVRRLSACETMGGATCICSDKTGTLTLNQMSVVKAWVAGDFRQDGISEALQNQVAPYLFRLLLEGLAQNSSGSVFVSSTSSSTTSSHSKVLADQSKSVEPVEVTGSPTEKALLSWGLKLGMDFQKVRTDSTILQVESFNSTKKRAGVAVKAGDTGDVRIHWKGAAEIVLQECNSVMLADGSAALITEAKREELLKVIEGMAGESLRCIAFAYRGMGRDAPPETTEEQEWEIPETGLSLVAMVGIKDPCRPRVAEAVKRCKEAGIKVRMVTGDNIATAMAIARECGILDEAKGEIAVEGARFRGYTEEERKVELPRVVVMARSSPSDKLLMVRTLRGMGDVVAVTGDGTNDAPALHEADIGLAMGIQGTEVAKDCSDIIILDDNFSSVVNVVRWGRSVYSNIQKFIQFQLTVNVAALTVNFVAAVSSGDVPLTAVQLLWVNLIMDTLGALALATEPPTEELMSRPPVAATEPIISAVMWRNIVGQALYQITILLVLQFDGKSILGLSGPDADRTNNTIIFNAFVLCQLFNEVNARRPNKVNIFKGFLNNKLFLGILFTTFVLQVVIVELLNKFASTIGLHWQHWLICIVIGFFSWPIAALLKLFINDAALASLGRRFSAFLLTMTRSRWCRSSAL